jgi:hypothetical protein
MTVRQPTRRLDLGQVSGRLYDALDWMSRHTVLGCNAEDVAKFLLTREMQRRQMDGEFERDAEWSRWLDGETAWAKY